MFEPIDLLETASLLSTGNFLHRSFPGIDSPLPPHLPRLMIISVCLHPPISVVPSELPVSYRSAARSCQGRQEKQTLSELQQEGSDSV